MSQLSLLPSPHWRMSLAMRDCQAFVELGAGAIGGFTYQWYEMTKFNQCVVLTYSLIALAGTGQAPAGASQPPIEISQTAAETTPAETSKASAETNPAAADVSASFG